MKRKPKEEEIKVKKDIALKIVNEKKEEEKSSMDENDVSLLTQVMRMSQKMKRLTYVSWPRVTQEMR